jgi:hypothetical protein
MPKTETPEVDPTIYLEKGPTALQERFATWIKDEVGYNPSAAKTKAEAFEEGVRIATATRMVFQASAYNRAANEEARKAREAAEAQEIEEAPAPAPKAKKAAPTKKAAANKAAPVEEEETEEEETEEKAPAPAARSTRSTRRPARRAAPTNEAPF